MAATTAISWCDHTWSPWYGCTQVSMGAQGACVGCYARHLSETRHKRVVFGGPGRGIGTRDAKADSGWKEPLKWEREVAALERAWHAGPNGGMGPQPYPYRPSVFPSMCDPFDNHPDLVDLRRRFFDLIRKTPHLTWLLLTKRPQNIVKLFNEVLDLGADMNVSHLWPPNAAIGCTVVTQAEADRDIPVLLAAKAALRPAFAFLSMEPLLGPVDLEYPKSIYPNGPPMCCGGFECGCMGKPVDPPLIWGLDWVITGGETDQGQHKARPAHPDWFRSLRDQCAAARVAYHHKQNGEWDGQTFGDKGIPGTTSDWATIKGVEYGADKVYSWADGSASVKVGKKTSGRMLDGVTHDARPEIAA